MCQGTMYSIRDIVMHPLLRSPWNKPILGLSMPVIAVAKVDALRPAKDLTRAPPRAPPRGISRLWTGIQQSSHTRRSQGSKGHCRGRTPSSRRRYLEEISAAAIYPSQPIQGWIELDVESVASRTTIPSVQECCGSVGCAPSSAKPANRSRDQATIRGSIASLASWRFPLSTHKKEQNPHDSVPAKVRGPVRPNSI